MASEHLDALAQRVEEDPFFLGCSLRLYAKSEELSEGQLAAALECASDQLALLRLCRAPAAEVGQFQMAMREISAKFQINAEVLAAAIRRGQAIFQMARPGSGKSTLAAARDSEGHENGPTDQRGDT